MNAIVGKPTWYELATPDLAGAAAFYGPLLNWQFRDAGMEGFTYHLASRGEAMVAGMMTVMPEVPPHWLIYFEVASADAAVAATEAAGGRVLMSASDVPETGRFAVLADPQGAAFGILEPLPGMPSQAYDPMQSGHGNWHELNTTEPGPALSFYTALFGWTPTQAMPMGEMGDYQLFAQGGRDIGGMMRLQSADVPPYWMPYFGTASIKAAMAQITASGGKVHHGPQEVPGGAFICLAEDPQGVHFALVGGA
ncbi:bleomycin resistance protein [Gemmobacter aquaticus]|uniref:Bleomycin resistance protein n=1 Tax=Gemmobacter aquaticus TaxID=490185 RepID=A0A918DCI9_9RHOB|nr:VOC family protein [Gemmobacter aquaticus]GGO30674.1 bleomycin resistance protein [Gemmobacter aquaticus]